MSPRGSKQLEKAKDQRGSARRLGPQPLSGRATATIQQLLDAGGRVFVAYGYHNANVDQLVAEAELSRGTFYKYFDDKLDLMRTLSTECEAKTIEVVQRLPTSAAATTFGGELRRWLPSFLHLIKEYPAVFRLWMEANVADDVIQASANRVGQHTLAAVTTLAGSVERSYPFDYRAACLMFVALLERVPQATALAEFVRTDDALVEVLACFVERGLLNPGRSRSKRQPKRTVRATASGRKR